MRATPGINLAAFPTTAVPEDLVEQRIAGFGIAIVAPAAWHASSITPCTQSGPGPSLGLLESWSCWRRRDLWTFKDTAIIQVPSPFQFDLCAMLAVTRRRRAKRPPVAGLAARPAPTFGPGP
jgi:hypothetical protein